MKGNTRKKERRGREKEKKERKLLWERDGR